MPTLKKSLYGARSSASAVMNPPPECPECHSAELEKLLSTFALSTDGTRQSNALKSRQQQIAKNKDKIIADEEHRMHHDD